MVPNRLRRLVERALPWYEQDAELERNRRTEALRQRSIKARIAAEAIQTGYREYAERLRK